MEQGKNNDKINELLTKIKGIKHIKIIIGILIAAIIMLVYVGITSNKTNETINENTMQDISETNATYSENEEKLADILERIEGIGKTKVMITYRDEEKVNGVIVVAEGADNPLSEWKIRHAVQTALKIDYHSIEVYSMK